MARTSFAMIFFARHRSHTSRLFCKSSLRLFCKSTLLLVMLERAVGLANAIVGGRVVMLSTVCLGVRLYVVDALEGCAINLALNFIFLISSL